MDNRHIQFVIQPTPIAEVEIVEQIRQLLDIASFWAQGRSVEDLATALAHSEPVVLVWDGDRVIGHARAISDGVYRATIWDVVIHPDYQGRGLGRKLVQTVLAHPKLARVERVYLTTTYQQQFYERIGFKVNPSSTMVLFNESPAVTSPTDVEVAST